MVGVRGFEPRASATRTQRSTKLSYTPHRHHSIGAGRQQANTFTKLARAR